MITILLLIASQGYQPQEYGYTRQELEKAGIKVVVASDTKGIAQALPSAAHAQVCDDLGCGEVVKKYPEFSSVQVDLQISEINVQKYDGIFLIGGPGALEFLDNQNVYNLMQSFAVTKKTFGAICLSPRVLAHAGLLQGKRATGWNGDNLLQDVFQKYNVKYVQKSVVVDGNSITADGPQSARDFGKAIVKMLLKK